MFESNRTLAESIVKLGLPFIIILLSIGILLSIIIVKIIFKENYFDYVTKIIIELFDCEEFEILNQSNGTNEPINQKRALLYK